MLLEELQSRSCLKLEVTIFSWQWYTNDPESVCSLLMLLLICVYTVDPYCTCKASSSSCSGGVYNSGLCKTGNSGDITLYSSLMSIFCICLSYFRDVGRCCVKLDSTHYSA